MGRTLEHLAAAVFFRHLISGSFECKRSFLKSGSLHSFFVNCGLEAIGIYYYFPNTKVRGVLK